MRSYVLLALGLFFLGQESYAQLLLKNATIINGDAAIKPRKGSLLIRGEKIVQIIDDPAAIPAGVTRVIDCTGKFITPGLMDAHVHLATVDMNRQKRMHAKTDSILENMLRHGITSVRDMAGDAIFLAEYKRAIATGQLTGPDIFYAAQFAGPGYFAMMKGSSRADDDLGTTPWYCAITPQTNIALAVAAAKGAGASGIKIYADLTKEQIAAITREAHARGLQAWSHGTVFPAKPMDGVAAGVNSLSHAGDFAFQQLKGDTLALHGAWAQLYSKSFVFDTTVQVQLLKAMQQRGIFLDPTIFHASNNKLYNAFTVTRIAHRLGVKIVTGTDWIYPEKNEPVPLMNEMLLLVSKCGLTIPEAIQCATLNSATVTGLHDRGQIREGALADLLITNTNPYISLPALFQPEMVIKRGQVRQW
ncbi:amidohydrolase family protein [Chitinophaga arvensicola]|uniref:Imidazolonepropionase n=1 Tax=Chitinophaga arvensicola TaxID=29529 RepID=A0A1I0RF14_9BACT|nr:amidohydrolase family protein [Chitinophaga arvensicola]SEW39272.1 Imidazolonepropionase [Chitinophaga arvensicola]